MNTQPDLLTHMGTTSRFLFSPFTHIWQGAKANRLPWGFCALSGVALMGLRFAHVDSLWLKSVNLSFILPKSSYGQWIYASTLGLFPLWAWGFLKAVKYNHWKQRLELAFQTSGLKNRLGKTPRPVFHHDLDPHNSKWIVSSANFPLSEFKKSKEQLEAGLKIYIDEFRENRTKGLVSIHYSDIPLPSIDILDSFEGLKPLEFYVGKTRAQRLKGSFKETPHLLIAGQTGGGKSTFLRQLILGLLQKSPNVQLTLIDLKGGLEFQMFEGLPDVCVCGDMPEAVQVLNHLAETLSHRIASLKKLQVKDLETLEHKSKRKAANSKNISQLLMRHIIVIDEAAELFLAGSHSSATDTMEARKALSIIARQGRAVGIHLVIATQRPDAKAVDSQVKANLTGVLCFQMMNDSSSIAVLGNGRATDLPSIPGRALWKLGLALTELQTPFLDSAKSESHLQLASNERSKTGGTI